MTQTMHHHGNGTAGCGGHAHEPGQCHVPKNADTTRLAWALVVIATFAVVELVGGVISNALALIADAGHMVTDAVAIAIALGARMIAKAPRTAAMPYGRTRVQVLAAFVNGLALFVLIGILVVESLQRVASPESVRVGTMLVIAIIGLAANAVAFWILHSGDRQDINMRGATLHVMGDMLGSVAAILSAIVIAFTGWFLFDPLVTLIVCALIGRSAFALTREATHVLLQGAPRHLDLKKVRETLMADVPEIVDVHDLKVWCLTPGDTQLTMHVRLKPRTSLNHTLAAAKAHLAATYEISSSIIQVEMIDNANSLADIDPTCPDHRVDEFTRRPVTGAPVH